jgi:hypothetical protein
MSFMCCSDIHSFPGDVHFFKVPFPLNWLNQSQIALLTGGSLPCVWQKLLCIVVVDLLLAALCFLLHTGHLTNCGGSFAYVHYACAWSMLKGCVCVSVRACVRARTCVYMCMCKKTLCIDEHITSNPTSMFLFS